MVAFIEGNTHLIIMTRLKLLAALNSRVDISHQSLWSKCKSKLQGISRNYMQEQVVKLTRTYREKMQDRLGLRNLLREI